MKLRGWKPIIFGFTLLAILVFAFLNIPRKQTTSQAATADSSTLTSQADWQSGSGTNTDLDTDPGSIRITKDITNGYYSLAADSLSGDSTGSAFGTDGTDLYSTNGVYTVDDPDAAKMTYKYDVSENTWSQVANRSITRGLDCGAGGDGKFYVFGGRQMFVTGLTTVEAYDPGSDSWQTMTPMSHARRSCTAKVVGNNIYVFGGTTLISEVYSISGNSWSDLASMPAALDFAGTAYLDDAIYLFKNTTAYKYDISENSWTTLGTIPFTAVAAADKDGTIYVFGGDNETYTYNPALDSYTSLNLAGDGETLTGSYAVTLGDYIYLYEAWTGASSTPLAHYPTSVEYFSTATQTSDDMQIDAGDHDSVSWTTFAPTANIVANTAISFRFRTSDDGSSWSSWSDSTAYAASIDISALSHQRYLQVESSLSSSDGVNTPSLQSYIANYEYDDTPAPTCSDGSQNGDETGVDCGGSCEACPAPETCSDGIQNQDETGVDCGGSCGACASCSDGIKNQDETGVDCGGVCGACPVTPTCTDGVKNGDETGVDCGGSCPACKDTSCHLEECKEQATTDLLTCQGEALNGHTTYTDCINNYCVASQACYESCGGADGKEETTVLERPNGGESYNVTENVPLSWYYLDNSKARVSNNNASVILSLSLDGGDNYTPIKLLIPDGDTSSPLVAQSRYSNNLTLGTFAIDTASKSYSYNWIPENPSYATDHARLKIEPQLYNCMVVNRGDVSDNDFRLYALHPQLFLSLYPSTAKTTVEGTATFTATAALDDGQDVTKTTIFKFSTSSAASIISQEGNNIKVKASAAKGLYDKAIIVEGTYDSLKASAYSSLEINELKTVTPTPPSPPAKCNLLCEIVGVVKAFIEQTTAAEAKREILSAIAFLFAIGNLVVNSIRLGKDLISPFIKGKDKKVTFSLVYDAYTGRPLPGIKIMLVNLELGNLASVTTTDKNGKFSLELSSGKHYRIEIENSDYKIFSQNIINTDNSGLAYANNYHGEEFTAQDDQLHFTKNIPLQSSDPSALAAKIRSVAKINSILVAANFPFCFAGAGIAIMILSRYPILFNYLICILYILVFLLYLIRIWLVEGKGMGVVKDQAGKYVDLAIIRAFRPADHKLVHTVVTDHEGQFSFALPKGIYSLSAVKTGFDQTHSVQLVIRSPFKPSARNIEMQELPKYPDKENLEVKNDGDIFHFAGLSANSASDMIDRYDQEKTRGDS